MDVSKLKVAELRAELSERGLDTKGVKAVLVQRLLAAIEEETGEEQEQHTVLETSTEEVSDSDNRRDSKDSEADSEDPLKEDKEDQRESSPEVETASAAPSVAVEPPTSEKDLDELEEVDGSPQNVEDSNSSSNETGFRQNNDQEDSREYQQDNVVSEADQADYQIEDSTNTNDFQQSDSNVSSDFTKEKPAGVVYQEQNSVEFQQGDNANQQWTNQQDDSNKEEPAAATVVETMEAESTTPTQNGHVEQDEAPPGTDDAKMDTTAPVEGDEESADVKASDEDESRAKRRRDRKNRWGPSAPGEESTPDVKKRKTSEAAEEKEGDGEKKEGEKEKPKAPREKTPEPEAKKIVQVEKPENEPELKTDAFTLSWYDSDLNLTIDTDTFTYGSPMSDQGFVYMWAGARASYGFNKGKIYYEVMLKEYCDTTNYDADKFPHQLRVGASVKSSSLQLGEDALSFGFETTGQIVHNNEYSLFGKPASVEDSVGVYIDFESDPEYIILRFALNGQEIKLVRRQVKEQPAEESEYEDVEEQVEDLDEEEEEEEEKKEDEEKKEEEEKKEDEKKKEDEEKKPEEADGEEKMEGVEEEGDGKKDSPPAPPAKKVEPKKKKFKTVIVKKKIEKKERPVEYEYLPEQEGDEIAFKISKAELGDAYLFPHILTKNIKYEVNFGNREEPWFAPSFEGYIFPTQISEEDRQAGPARPEKRADCEMLMMCGLPGAGKTFWVRDHVKNNPEKMYNVFGTFSLINKMKINSEPLRKHVKSRWDQVVDKTTKCLNRLLELGFTRRRNYILDQTNVYISAQKRKMRSYYGFQRRALIVVPSKEDYIIRLELHREQEGRDDVPPDHVILEMKANFKLPEVGELFEEVRFIELQREEAEKIIEVYNKEGRDAGYGRFDNGRGIVGSAPRRRDNRDSRDFRGPQEFRGGYGGPRGGGGGFGGRGGRMDRPPMWGGPPRERRGGMGGRGGGRWGGDRDDSRPPRGGFGGPRGGFGRGGGRSRDSNSGGEDATSAGEESGSIGGRPGRSEGGWSSGRDGGDRRGRGRDDRSGGGGRGSWGGGSRSGFGGDRSGFGGDRSGFGGDRSGFGGDRSGFGGDRSGFGGDRSGFGGDRSGFDNDRSGRGGAGSGGYGGGNRFGGGNRSSGGGSYGNDRRDRDKKGGQQSGGWGNQNQQQMQQQGGWGSQGGWGGNQNQQNQWGQWSQQNWNQWNQWQNQAAQQWAGYGQQGQSQSGAQSQTGSASTQQAQSSGHTAASNTRAAAAVAGPTATAQASTAVAATGAAASTQYPQGYNTQQAQAAYAGYNTGNYSGWTAQQYQQYYAAQGWTQNADGSYNYPQNWNAQNWQGYGYSTAGQTGTAGQIAGQQGAGQTSGK